MNKKLLIICSIMILLVFWGCDSDDNKGVNSDDVVAPTAIANLRIMGAVDSTCILSWTATGDDLNEGTAASYDLRFATDSVTLLLWDAASQEDVQFNPAQAGRLEFYEIGGLNSDSQYYFAIKAIDESENTSDISNIASESQSVFPTITLTYPIQNQYLPEMIEVTADASDDKGIAYVKFFANGLLFETDPTAPYSAIWTGNSFAHGTVHSFYAQAFDTEDNLTGTEVVTCQTDTSLFFPQPSNIISNYSLSDSSVILIWEENDDTDFDSYVILYDTVDFSDTTAAFMSNEITESDSTIVEVVGLLDITQYYFQVQTQDQFSHVSKGNIVSDTTLNGPPSALSLSVSNVQLNSISLLWTVSLAHDFSSYSVYRSLDENVTTADDVDTGIVYYYAVLEEDLYGLSTFSNVVGQSSSGVNFVLEFDGDDYCIVPHYAALNYSTQFTIEAWVYQYSHSDYVRVVDKTESTCCLQYNLLLHNGRPGIDNGTQTSTYSRLNSSSVITLNEWHHVSITYNAGQIKYYIDGNLADTDASVVTLLQPFVTELNFGRRKMYNEFYFHGMIDEIRMWNVERSSTEIADSYNHYLTGLETGLIGYWTFNEGEGASSQAVVGNDCQLGSQAGVDSNDPTWVDSAVPIIP
ncbi:MAG: hypothetical protein KAR42_02280 [candidate division Zixibacteria bacterium]|nr:hypothetical protein [candidate division Zixibacteria bacterium]